MKTFYNYHIIPVHKELTKAIGKLTVTDTTQVTRFNEDLYIIDNSFPEHIDNNDPNKDVYLLVLVNNGGYSLHHHDCVRKRSSLNQGYMYSFDGNIIHSMIGNMNGKHRFAAIIWDIEKCTDPKKIYYEMAHRVLELEEFVLNGGELKQCT